MLASELKRLYLSFFKNQGHTIIPSASIIPENDATVLFTTAGMHPLVPFLLGAKHPGGKRLVNCQKCLRTGDIESVGDRTHGTFFEMLGNWSLGDYFKEESIAWSYEFLTSGNWLGIDDKRLFVTVFAGDKDAPRDDLSANIWQKVGIPVSRIFFLPKSENWWGPPGEVGPCGPDTEIFYDTGLEKCSSECRPGCNCGKFFEIWNNVFMEYRKIGPNEYEQLQQKNVDTGMGVERTSAVLQGKQSIYDTELFQPLIAALEELSGKKSSGSLQRSFYVISDHVKAATFIMGDPQGISPSNLGKGYVLRRLIRRAVRQAKYLGIGTSELVQVAKTVVNIYELSYPELTRNWSFIKQNFVEEGALFSKTLSTGLREFEKAITEMKKQRQGAISGRTAFNLYDTYGFPLELTIELAKERGIGVDVEGYKEHFKKHQEVSRAGSKQHFKGGLADTSKETTKLHTATHLLHKALKIVLGDHVEQRGSNINPTRLRFDFSHTKKMTEEEKILVERIVNEQIALDLSVTSEEMSVEEAKKQGAIGLFGSRYGSRVKVYSIGDYSMEICGGPHVKSTRVLGRFKIKKESSSSRGIRRIKAVLISRDREELHGS